MSAVQRFVWDSDQLLHEISAPGGSDASPEEMESDSAQGSYANRAYNHGRVVYTHGLGIDAPLSLVRVGYSDVIPDPVQVVPFADWSGKYDGGTGRVCVLIEGTSRTLREVVWSPGENPPATSDDTGATEECVEIDWPAKTLWHSYDRRSDWTGPKAWMGSLIQHGRDPSGQLYRRNRYYDPSTGVFTQEDPIGLAGGINLYGFADGDPVSFDDPFGLCPENRRNAEGSCPGGLTVAEWKNVESASNRLKRDARTRALEMLNQGKIQGRSFLRNHYAEASWNGEIFFDRDQNSSVYGTRNILYHPRTFSQRCWRMRLDILSLTKD